MTSLPNPPMRLSLAPRPRISSSPSKPSSSSGLSVPESGPPLGQPGTLLVTHRPDGPCRSMGCVSAHRASSEAALAERVCSLVASVCPCCLGLSERVSAQPTTRRRAYPITKAPTIAMRCPWRTMAPLPSLCMCSLLFDLAGAHKPHHHQQRCRHHHPHQPCHRASRNDPRGVGERIAPVLWLLTVAEQSEFCASLGEWLGPATEIDLKILLAVGVDQILLPFLEGVAAAHAGDRSAHLQRLLLWSLPRLGDV